MVLEPGVGVCVGCRCWGCTLFRCIAVLVLSLMVLGSLHHVCLFVWPAHPCGLKLSWFLDGSIERLNAVQKIRAAVLVFFQHMCLICLNEGSAAVLVLIGALHD